MERAGPEVGMPSIEETKFVLLSEYADELARSGVRVYGQTGADFWMR